MKCTQAYPEQIKIRDCTRGSCLIKVLLTSRGVSSIFVTFQGGEGGRKRDTDLNPTPDTAGADVNPWSLLPPTSRSCPSWFFSALWCPCCTTSDWCSGLLERYRDWKGVGDKCRTDYFRDEVLNAIYLGFISWAIFDKTMKLFCALVSSSIKWA